MKKHLEKLKKKPDHHKQKMAQTMALIATGIVILLWILIRTLAPEKATEIQTNTSSNISETFNTIFDTTSSELADIKKEFSEQPNIGDLLQQAQEEGIEIDPELSEEIIINQNGERTETTTE